MCFVRKCLVCAYALHGNLFYMLWDMNGIGWLIRWIFFFYLFVGLFTIFLFILNEYFVQYLSILFHFPFIDGYNMYVCFSLVLANFFFPNLFFFFGFYIFHNCKSCYSLYDAIPLCSSVSGVL